MESDKEFMEIAVGESTISISEEEKPDPSKGKKKRIP
jgi:hypothetical protein